MFLWSYWRQSRQFWWVVGHWCCQDILCNPCCWCHSKTDRILAYRMLCSPFRGQLEKEQFHLGLQLVFLWQFVEMHWLKLKVWAALLWSCFRKGLWLCCENQGPTNLARRPTHIELEPCCWYTNHSNWSLALSCRYPQKLGKECPQCLIHVKWWWWLIGQCWLVGSDNSRFDSRNIEKY